MSSASRTLACITQGIAASLCLGASGCATFATYAEPEVAWMQKHQMDAKAPLCSHPIAHEVRWVSLRPYGDGGLKVADDATRPLVEKRTLWSLPAQHSSAGQVFERHQPQFLEWAAPQHHPVFDGWAARFTASAPPPPFAAPVQIEPQLLPSLDLAYEGRYGDFVMNASRLEQQTQDAWDAQERINSGRAQLGDEQKVGIGVNLGMVYGMQLLAMAAAAKKETNDREVLLSQTAIEHLLKKSGAVSDSVPDDRILYVYMLQTSNFDKSASIVDESARVLAFVTRPSEGALTASRRSTLYTTVNADLPRTDLVPCPLKYAFELPMYLATDATYALCVAEDLDSPG